MDHMQKTILNNAQLWFWRPICSSIEWLVSNQQLRQFWWLMVESDPKTHTNSNSKPISSLHRKRWVQSDVQVHAGIKHSQPAARVSLWVARRTACRRGYTDVNLWMARRSPAGNAYIQCGKVCGSTMKMRRLPQITQAWYPPILSRNSMWQLSMTCCRDTRAYSSQSLTGEGDD